MDVLELNCKGGRTGHVYDGFPSPPVACPTGMMERLAWVGSSEGQSSN